MIWIYLVAIIVPLLYIYWRWHEGYFERRGIKCVPSDFPFMGHMLKIIMQKEHPMETTMRLYMRFPNERYVGFKQMNRNTIMIRDTEIIKSIAIKDFDHFADHLMAITEEMDDLVGKSLFSLQGEKWRDMRATLSPAFTSSKMKNMFQFVVEIGEQMTEYFVDQMKTEEFKEKGLLEVEMKDAFTRYTNDVITTSALGVKVNSLTDRDNMLYRVGKDLSSFEGIGFAKLFLILLWPKVAKMLNVRLVSNHIKKVFRDLVLDTMKHREENNVVRQDMIHLLIEAKRGALKHDATTTSEDHEDAGFATVKESQVGQKAVKRRWTDDEMVAQGMIFYMAGFDTVSTLLCFMSHQLAVNQEIQKKLLAEIDEIELDESGHLTYGHLTKMPYMDMVVSETLRKWPPLPNTDRKCLKAFKLPPPSSESSEGYTVQPGESLMIPIVSIHYDPKYYPNPEVFDPERFSEENKGNVQPFTYLPFGIGPRNCIGSRFALMEAKSVMFNLLKRFEFVKIEKTQDPIKLSTKTFNLVGEKGFWIGLKPRYA